MPRGRGLAGRGGGRDVREAFSEEVMSVLSWELSSESHILLCPSPLTILSVYPPCPRPPVCYIISLSDCGQLSPTSPEGPRKLSPPPLDTSVTRHLLYFQAEWFDLSMSCLLSSMQNPLPKFPLSGLFFCQMSSGFIPSPPQVSAQKSPYPRPFLTSLHKCPQPLPCPPCSNTLDPPSSLIKRYK